MIARSALTSICPGVGRGRDAQSLFGVTGRRWDDAVEGVSCARRSLVGVTDLDLPKGSIDFKTFSRAFRCCPLVTEETSISWLLIAGFLELCRGVM